MGGGTHTDGNTVSLELPSGLFAALEKESKRKRQTVTNFLANLLQDQEEATKAQRRWKDIESGKTKTIPADQVFKDLGLL